MTPRDARGEPAFPTKVRREVSAPLSRDFAHHSSCYTCWCEAVEAGVDANRPMPPARRATEGPADVLEQYVEEPDRAQRGKYPPAGSRHARNRRSSRSLVGNAGQALVELAAALPIVLVMFAGLYVACRTGFLASGAHSAAQAEALRAARALPGIEKQLSADLLPGETGGSVRSEPGKKARLLPAPFPALAGRSSGVASVSKEWWETGGIGAFAPLALVSRADVSADCWSGNSRSGKNIRRAVRARIALGAIR